MKIEIVAPRPTPVTGLLYASLHRAYLGTVRTEALSGKAAHPFSGPGGTHALQHVLLMPQS